MAVILFDNFPSHGHYNGTLKFSKLLKDAGHTVCYAGPSDFQEKLRPLGIDFFVIDPFILLPMRIELKEKGFVRFVMENFARIFHDKKPEQIEGKIREYDAMISQLKPDLIILDEHYAYKSIFYWKYNNLIATIKTGLTAEYAPSVPPFYSSYVPRKSKLSKLYVEFLWNKHIVKSTIINFFYKIVTFDGNRRRYIKMFAERYNFPYKKEILRRRTAGMRFKNIPSLVLPPEAYDFPRSLKRNLFVIGPIFDKNDYFPKIEGRLKSVIDQVSMKKKDNPQIKLIYCSLGTVTVEFLKVCSRFFRYISTVCSRNPHWRIILSVGTFFDISQLASIPNNLYIFEKVPQVALLANCDLVITHGGMNTIYESIMAEKPMIVFPLSLKNDQNGNAARVVYHQIGLRGVIRKSTPQSIASLLNKVIEDEALFMENIRQLKSKFVDKSAYALELIERIIKEGNPR